MTNNPQLEGLKEEQELWDLYREVMQTRGIDIGDFYLAAVEQLKHELPSGARTDFLELVNTGCSPVVLGLLVTFIRHLPSLKEFWERTIGGANERMRAKRELPVFGHLVSSPSTCSPDM